MQALRLLATTSSTAATSAATTTTTTTAAATTRARCVVLAVRRYAAAAAPAKPAAKAPAGKAPAAPAAGGKAVGTTTANKAASAIAAAQAKLVSNLSLRTGLIGRKMGMTHTWTEWGDRIPLTAIQIVDNEVVGVRTPEVHGYTALQVGAINEPREHKLTKALRGMFASANVSPKKTISEFRVSPDAVLPTGTKLFCTHFIPGQLVDVVGRTIGKGFAGPMKRHNMKGGRATHGSTLQHRKIGSIGAGGDPARVWPGKRMAGHMGNVNTRHARLLVYKVDPRWGIVYLKGNVPGHEDTLLRIVDSNAMRKAEIKLPVPTLNPETVKDVVVAPKAAINPLTVIRT